ncbi:hypothetical protein EDD36DRAFT_22456 [Exophiala viscosa]|uniref:DUF1772 domain-containing protein n=1 Tax=Exophiala viscosa TaxID=2486360 RepID=A0AAN6E4T6_9EURO|nr:hypothetical protein EDD36DRAFT_22456 [Exophiala viscosa]
MPGLTFSDTAAVVGSISSLLLAGVNFSASQLTLPILYRIPDETSTSIFEELFYRGGMVIVPLTLFATLCTGTTAYLEPTARSGYTAAAVASFASLPFTGLYMRPTIQRLLKLANDEKVRQKADANEAVSLLKRWRWMNFVRAALALVGGAVGLAVLLGAW